MADMVPPHSHAIILLPEEKPTEEMEEMEAIY